MEAGASSLAMNAARLDLTEVGQEGGQDLIRAPHQTACAQVKLTIGDMVEVIGGGLIRNLGFVFGLSVHDASVHLEISRLWQARSAVFWSKNDFALARLHKRPLPYR